MSTGFHPSSDFARVIDDLAQVTLIRAGTLAETVVNSALSQTIRTREAESSGGRYLSSDVVWHLPAAQLPEAPRPGDVLVESGRRWTILDVQQATLRSRWRCVCRELAITAGLDEFVDIEKALYEKTNAGAQRAVWFTWRSGVRAKIQAAASTTGDQHDGNVTTARFTIFCEENLALDHTYRLKGPGGAVYRILACRKTGRVDALMEIDAVRVEQAP